MPTKDSGCEMYFEYDGKKIPFADISIVTTVEPSPTLEQDIKGLKFGGTGEFTIKNDRRTKRFIKRTIRKMKWELLKLIFKTWWSK